MPTTSNMGMLLPIPTKTPGPTYASENNDAFEVIDGHDHSPGKGLPIPSNAININNNLSFNGYSATSFRSTQYAEQTSPISLPTDLNSIYSVNGNLYWNNQIGQQVQLTSGAALNASSIGGIGGDYVGSGALEFYTSASKTFTFWSSTNTPANLDAGSLTIRPVLLNAFGITINAPLSLAANYSMVLPSALPSSSLPLVSDTSGNLTFSQITGTAVANQTITQGLLAPRPTGTTVAAGGLAISTSSGAYVLSSGLAVVLTVVITTTGRPVMIGLMPDTSGSASFIGVQSPSGVAEGQFFIQRDGTDVGGNDVYTRGAPVAGLSTLSIPPSSIYVIDPVAAGTYTYTLVVTSPASHDVFVNYTVLYAYEL